MPRKPQSSAAALPAQAKKPSPGLSTEHKANPPPTEYGLNLLRRLNDLRRAMA